VVYQVGRERVDCVEPFTLYETDEPDFDAVAGGQDECFGAVSERDAFAEGGVVDVG